MQRARCLTKALQAHAGNLVAAEAAGTACQINAAARPFSSAATTSRLTSISNFGKQDEKHQHSQVVFPQQQLTSLLSFPHARNFSSSDSEELPSHEDTASSLSAFDPSMVLDAVTNSEEGSWLAAREGCWFFNRYMQSVLRFAQETTGLPWWETIAITTVVFRTLTIPFHIQSIKNTYNMTKARPEVERLAAQLRQEQENKNPNAMGEYQRKLAGVWKRHDAHPLKSILPIMMQAPIFIGFFTSLRALSEAKIASLMTGGTSWFVNLTIPDTTMMLPMQVPSLMTGGTSWFVNLTIPDTTMMLPFLAFGIFLLSAELGGADGMQGQPPHVISRFKWAMRVLTVVMVPFTKDLPAAVFIYWVTSNAWSFAQSMVLKQTAVKKYFGFPITTPKAGSNPTLTAVQPLGHAAGGKPIQTFAQRPQQRDKKKRR